MPLPLPSIVHDIWKSAQALKCLIVKSLKTKIVHTVTKGKRHSAGCTCENKNHTKTCECVTETNTVTMDECFWINAPRWCVWEKRGRKKWYVITLRPIFARGNIWSRVYRRNVYLYERLKRTLTSVKQQYQQRKTNQKSYTTTTTPHTHMFSESTFSKR